MIKLANKFAILISAITFVMCLLAGISLTTTFMRTGVVFIGMLLAFYISGQMLKLGLIVMTPQNKSDE